MEKKQQVETVLLTGALGYIGSHCAITLYDFIQTEAAKYVSAKLKILIIDNLSNCRKSVLKRINKIVGMKYGDENKNYFEFQECDILNVPQLEKIFKDKMDANEKINYIIHFAAKKSVSESQELPLLYYEVNVTGSLNVLKMMQKYKCKNFILSSSATLYAGQSDFTEESPVHTVSVYGRTKHMIEQMMEDQAVAYKEGCFFSLRYFNPAGCHPSGLIGDAPIFPSNLFPVIEQVVIGKREKVLVFGNDYETPDGSGIRDYIHIMDLVEGHVVVIKKMVNTTGFHIYNLGTGKGLSVLEILKAYSKVLGKQIPYEISARRPGDVAYSCAIVTKAEKDFGWKATRTLDQICQDSWNFIRNNPNGIVD